ncbi:hypothetical protein M0802_004084 [Mischocyttarus mexicanus]|nr:hypothetical protein M0802_004084 [Mischocyttarus mexicanus]
MVSQGGGARKEGREEKRREASSFLECAVWRRTLAGQRSAWVGGVLVSRGVITSRGVDYTVCPARNGASAQLGPPMMQGPPVPPPTRTYISILTNHYYMCLVSRVGPREHPATPVLRTWTKFTNNSPGLALYNGPTAA